MPAKTAKERGAEFLAGAIASLPAELQEKAKEVADALAPTIGEGVLRQDDYSRLASEAQTKQKAADELYAANSDWYTTREAELKELDALREKVKTGAPVVVPVVKPELPTDVVTKADLEKILGETERGALGFISEANALTLKHYQEFGEVLNIRDLLADKRVQQIGIQGVYADKFAPQIKAKADAAQAARDETLRKEGAAAERQRIGSTQHPYPVRGNETSTLDALEAAQKGQTPPVKDVADLATEYERLSSVRAGGAAV